MAVNSPQELLDELRQQQLLSAVNLDAVASELGQFASARQLADHLIGKKWLSKYLMDEVLAGRASALVLGPYRILDKLGHGGMGVVYKAWSERHNRVVALKVLRVTGVGSHTTDLLKRFERESKAIDRLQHPNVVTRFESDVVDGQHYIAMEYVEGVDLERKIQRDGVLGFAEAVNYVRQASLGLQHAYEAGLVHRDIKPSNLLVTKSMSSLLTVPRAATPLPGALKRPGSGLLALAKLPAMTYPWGVVKILDMGLARIGEAYDEPALTAITRQGTLLGTPDYMAPEQARDASAVDIRADLYALGGTLYFLLTGRPPFPDGTVLEKLQRHLTSHPQAVEAIRRDTPIALGDAIRKLLAKRPEERFQSPLQLIEALDGLVLPDAEARPDPGPVIGTTIETARTPVPTVVDPRGPGAVSPPLASPTTRYQPPTPADLVLPSKTLAAVSAHQGFVTSLAFSPDGTLLASGGLDDSVHLWNTGSPRVQELAALRRELGEVMALAFAPTQPYLVTGSSGIAGHMWRWEWRAKGATERALVPDEPARIDVLAFSPTAKLLAGSAAHLIRVWSAAGSGLRRKTDLKGHGARVKCLAFSPDGRLLVSGGEYGEVFVWDFGRWMRVGSRRFQGHKDDVLAAAFPRTGELVATGSVDGTIHLWQPATGAETGLLAGPAHKIRDLTFTPSGRHLVSLGDGGQVFLWDVAARAKVRQWQLDVRGMAVALALAPGGRLAAVGSSDGTVTVSEIDLGTDV